MDSDILPEGIRPFNLFDPLTSCLARSYEVYNAQEWTPAYLRERLSHTEIRVLMDSRDFEEVESERTRYVSTEEDNLSTFSVSELREMAIQKLHEIEKLQPHELEYLSYQLRIFSPRSFTALLLVFSSLHDMLNGKDE